MKKILIIQTAFIGDVILATSLVDQVRKYYPEAQIDFVLRNGNESLLQGHQNIKKVWIWNKKKNKTFNLLRLALKLRKEKYDLSLNIQRFFNSGLLSFITNAKLKIGFNTNPLNFLFDKKVIHNVPLKKGNSYYHEVQRNMLLLEKAYPGIQIPSDPKMLPLSLYPTDDEKLKISKLTQDYVDNYVVVAPASVWFTKQWDISKWQQLCEKLSKKYQVLAIGAPSDNEFVSKAIGQLENCHNLCGKLSLKESAELMRSAKRVFVNDSAPLHLASAVNAKTTAIFCSTIPEFGYGPLAQDSILIQLSPRLECMPCGIHGKKACPLGHFKCALDVDVDQVIQLSKLEDG